MSTPVFVVVGHVNRGKSSIVAALSADDSVHIAPYPGTTQHNREYPMRLGNEVLYRMIDTPGFERPRHVLEWLRQQNPPVTERRAAVERFVKEHEASGEYRAECQLLRPILDGAAILYVVDGSVPVIPAAEAEMEILRWTTQPRLAVINYKAEADHSGAWRAMLEQYFHMVRDFDAQEVHFEDRLNLLRAMREMNEAWRGSIDRAIDALERDWAQRRRDSAREIARLIRESQALTLTERLAPGDDPEAIKRQLGDRYHRELQALEQRSRRRLAELYAHPHLEYSESPLDPVMGDLFGRATWSQLGLTRGQIEWTATVTGAIGGGVLDTMVGGTSFMLGSVLGAASAYALAKFAWSKVKNIDVLGFRLVGDAVTIGPMNNLQFPWILLDRAVGFHRIVSQRSHARRDPVELRIDEKTGPSSQLDTGVRRRFAKLFTEATKQQSADAVARIERELTGEIETLLVSSQ